MKQRTRGFIYDRLFFVCFSRAMNSSLFIRIFSWYCLKCVLMFFKFRIRALFPFLFGLFFSCWNTLNLCLHTLTQDFSTSFALQQHEYRARYWNTLGRSTPSEKSRILFFFISLMRDWFHFFLNRLMVHPVPFGLIETSTPKTKVWQGLLIPRRSSRLVASSWSSVKASWKSCWKRWLIWSFPNPLLLL